MSASLYFHVPFCTKKCPYCHFYVIPNRLSDQKLLSEGLLLEWQQKFPLFQDLPLVSVYFGGGTPSLFQGIGEILEKIPSQEGCEITIEANPEECLKEDFLKFRSLGINRLSLGVQSLDDRSLQTLERIHTAEKAKQAILEAKRAGFENISIDLMYDLPNQTEESFRYTLDQLEELPITHLSLYNLTIEPNTSFYKRKVKTAPPEQSLRLLMMALTKFEELGFKRYEISAFAKEGYESKHNLGYWTARPFLGFGPSAFSYWEGERFQNVNHLHRYVKALREGASPIHFKEKLPYPANVNELLAVRLRLKEGADTRLFSLPLKTQKTLERLKELFLLEQEGTLFKLTERGKLFYDTVASELM